MDDSKKPGMISLADRRPIFIVGYMASGKTTFGQALAKAAGRNFIDLDFYIEQRFHQSISEIFASGGEVSFRRKEAAMLREAGEFENVVIACGGGTPCFSDNMDFMLSHGTVVFLEATVEKMARRLEINNGRRPLMAGKSAEEIRKTIREGLEARLPFYERAHIRFSGEELEDRRQIDNAVKNFCTGNFF